MGRSVSERWLMYEEAVAASEGLVATRIVMDKLG